jgi:hypothetical protein
MANTYPHKTSFPTYSEDKENSCIVVYELDRRFPKDIEYRIKGRWYSPREAKNMVEQLQEQLNLYAYGDLPIRAGFTKRSKTRG